MRPMIGVMLRKNKESDLEEQYVVPSYLQALTEHGGDYLILPSWNQPSEEERKTLIRLVELCDGMLFPGGDEVTESDLFVFEQAKKRKLPILGICLGMQMMASYPELETLGKLQDGSHQRSDLKYVHSVILNKDSKLRRILDRDQVEVNSRHRQYVLSGGTFQVVGKTIDGIIEAIENPDHPFQIGVQWHPESMISYDECQQNLWKFFVEACIE